jgi:glycosyltransferase involved in cell wall biosynthesis
MSATNTVSPQADTTLLRPITRAPDPARTADPKTSAEPRSIAEPKISVEPRRLAEPRISVVIPAKNEVRNLPRVLAQLPPWLHEIIVVDGGSRDGTVSAALRTCPGVVIVQQTRRGKGNALSCGIAACSGDIIVTLDADGSTDPAEIPVFVAALVAGCDFAKGSRYLAGGGSTDLTPLRRAGNRMLAMTMNVLYGTSFTDLCYGYTAFRARCVDRLALPGTDGADAERGDGFEIETLLAAHAASARLKLAEVPSFEHPRHFGQSNLRTFSDGWRVLWTIVSERAHR